MFSPGHIQAPTGFTPTSATQAVTTVTPSTFLPTPPTRTTSLAGVPLTPRTTPRLQTGLPFTPSGHNPVTSAAQQNVFSTPRWPNHPPPSQAQRIQTPSQPSAQTNPNYATPLRGGPPPPPPLRRPQASHPAERQLQFLCQDAIRMCDLIDQHMLVGINKAQAENFS